MPSSRPNIIPIVVSAIRQLDPQSILDVGVGFGKWGHLFREYTDILASEKDPERYRREKWQVQIDGIEGFPSYLTPMHRFLYDNIFEGDALKVIPTLGKYDVIYMGDIIEHFDKEDGHIVLKAALERSNKAVIVSTPKYDTQQINLCDNELERHRSVWSERDFQTYKDAHVVTIDHTTYVAALMASSNTSLSLATQISGLPTSFRGRLFRYLLRKKPGRNRTS